MDGSTPGLMRDGPDYGMAYESMEISYNYEIITVSRFDKATLQIRLNSYCSIERLSRWI